MIGDPIRATFDIKQETSSSTKNTENTCSKCDEPIRERYVNRVLERSFHSQCLRCSSCDQELTTTCFMKHDLLYCKTHFYKRFGTKCAYCNEGIVPDSVIRRVNAHIYHVECFKCAACKREMKTGDEFYLIPQDGRIVCRSDYEVAKNKSPDSEMECSSKRPRTTISAKSLETLKQAYQASSKPARHIREQLAQETGLDMRVVQVWFQNRRAKEKRLKKDAGRRWNGSGLQKTDSDSNSPSESISGHSPGYGSGSSFSGYIEPTPEHESHIEQPTYDIAEMENYPTRTTEGVLPPTGALLGLDSSAITSDHLFLPLTHAIDPNSLTSVTQHYLQ